MKAHDRIQEGIRGYMAKTAGKYPAAVVLSQALWRQLSTCPSAIAKMRTVHTQRDEQQAPLVQYLGMRVFVSASELEVLLLLDHVPRRGLGWAASVGMGRSAPAGVAR